MKSFLTLSLCLLIAVSAKGQKMSAAIGTDFPYQTVYSEGRYALDRLDFSVRIGTLTPPYTEALFGLIGSFGVDQQLIDILKGTSTVGGMVTVGAYYKVGEQKKWFIGIDSRNDFLRTTESPASLIESVTGLSFPTRNNVSDRIIATLNLRLLGAGIRAGRSFRIGENAKTRFRVEFSISKYVSSKTYLDVNSVTPTRIIEELDNVLWKDVFKPYGYIGGLGISYSYLFSRD